MPIQSPLDDYLNTVSSYRLGTYFESLIAFWIQNASKWNLLAHDHQVRDEARTLGAFDFIVQDAEECEHWEVAVKYYLGVNAGPDWSNWIGPNQRDRLDLKMKKMCAHQIELSRHPAGIEVLNTLGIEAPPTQRIWLKGLFFRPWNVPSSGPHHASLSPQSVWVDALSIDAYLEDRPEETLWVQRHKPDWLGPTLNHELPLLKHQQLRTLVMTIRRPVMLSETDAKGRLEHKRIFIVPSDWQSNAVKLMDTLAENKKTSDTALVYGRGERI